MIKKTIKICLFAFAALLLVSCGDNKVNELTVPKETNIPTRRVNKIVTTIYPEYDWINNIIKGNEENFDICILMTSGIDLHNFQPTAKDLLDIDTADLFVYVGGESDDWAELAITQSTNKELKTINLMEVLRDKVKFEETIEGMQEETEEEHEDEHEKEYDEHVWLSLSNAMIICKALKDEIVALDYDNKNLYESNFSLYIEKLKSLDNEYKEAINSAKRNKLLFADRFPFRYLFDDYNLKYYAAFKGCSAETEASFETIKFLSDKLGEEKFPYVMKIERSEDKIARAVIDNSDNKDAQIETMYSIQADSDSDIKAGETYLSYMEKNLEVLKKVLN